MQNRKTTLTALLAVLFTVGALWITNRTVTPRQATWDDVLAEGQAGGYAIITTDELARRYLQEAGSLLLVDTRQEWEYHAGHLKGAVNFPMEPTGWSEWRKTPALERFIGPDKNRTLVFY